MAAAGISASFTIGEKDLKGLTYNKEYTLHEITPPSGYITASNDSKFTVKVDAQGQTVVELTGDNISQTVVDNTIVISISNEPGAELPHAGGIGTTLFYIFGAMLTLGCSVFLISRRRLQKNN